MHERFKRALLENAEAGAGSDDLTALIAYANQPVARWFIEDDERLDAMCGDYLAGRFNEELSDCSSESELSSLDDAVSLIAGKCGVSHEAHQEEIAQRLAEFEDPHVDDSDRPSSSWTRELSSNPSETAQEAEIIRLFDGLG